MGALPPNSFVANERIGIASELFGSIATYQALRNIPEPYKALAPVIDGVRRVLVEHGCETRKAHG